MTKDERTSFITAAYKAGFSLAQAQFMANFLATVDHTHDEYEYRHRNSCED